MPVTGNKARHAQCPHIQWKAYLECLTLLVPSQQSLVQPCRDAGHSWPQLQPATQPRGSSQVTCSHSAPRVTLSLAFRAELSEARGVQHVA